MQYVWFLKWWPYALSRIHNPFWTTLQWYPTGYNIALTTSIPSISLLVFPITYTLGPLPAFNIITILTPAIAATSAFALFYSITKRLLPSFVGGYLFGFSPYELGQLQGHLHLDFIATIPFALLLINLFWNDKISKTKFLMLFSLSLIFQFGTSLEVFATSTYFGFFAFLCWFLIDVLNRRKIIYLLRLIAYSYLTTAVACSLYIYYFIYGIKNAPAGFPYATHNMQANLLNYIIPNATIWYSYLFGKYATVSTTSDENDVYIGFAILLLMAYYLLKYKLSNFDKVALFTLSLTALLSLGSRIYFSNTYIFPGLWELVKCLPALRYALPNRLSLYVWLCVAFIITRLLSRLMDSSRIPSAIAIAAFSIISVAPNFIDSNNIFNSKIVYNNHFNNSLARTVMPENSNVLFIPFKTSTYPMFYQSVNNMKFNIIGGYLGQPTSAGLWPAVRTLINGWALVNPKMQFASYLAEHKANRIIVLRVSQHYDYWVNLFSSFGWHHIRFPGGIAFIVPHILRRDDSQSCSTASKCNAIYEKMMAKTLLSGLFCLRHRREYTSSILETATLGCLTSNKIFMIGDDRFSKRDLHNVDEWQLIVKNNVAMIATDGWYGELRSVLNNYCEKNIECFYPYPKPYNKSVGDANGILEMKLRVKN